MTKRTKKRLLIDVDSVTFLSFFLFEVPKTKKKNCWKRFSDPKILGPEKMNIGFNEGKKTQKRGSEGGCRQFEPVFLFFKHFSLETLSRQNHHTALNFADQRQKPKCNRTSPQQIVAMNFWCMEKFVATFCYLFVTEMLGFFQLLVL